MHRFHTPRSLRRLLWLALLLTLTLGAGAAMPATAQTPAQESVTLYFFWGDGCPHCARAKPFLAELTQRYPGLEVQDYEVWNHPENQAPFVRMAAKFGFEPSSVPTIFMGDRYWVGYAPEPVGREIEEAVVACLMNGCPDAGAGILAPLAPVATPDEAPVAAPQAAAQTNPGAGQGAQSAILTLPLLGSLNLTQSSLLVSTVLIALVDGVNPCSLWVLSVLLALTLHTGSRRKVLIIGLVFLTVTSLVYAIFIAGLFSMFTVLSFVGWIQVVVALVALFFAAVNIKDYFWYKEGISFTIRDEQKPGLYRRMRQVLDAGDSMPALIGAAVVMSAGASLVEFSCTAGFPVLWTNLLTAQGVSVMAFLGLLAVYMVIYQIDELAIFVTAVWTLKASRLQEKQGRILKLASGMLMLALAGVMLVNPSLMNGLGASLLVFGAAALATLLLLGVHRWLLPKWGIYIGSELNPPGQRAGQKKGKRRGQKHAMS